MSPKARSAILVAADSVKQIRPCDVWRVCDKAFELSVLSENLYYISKKSPCGNFYFEILDENKNHYSWARNEDDAVFAFLAEKL